MDHDSELRGSALELRSERLHRPPTAVVLRMELMGDLHFLCRCGCKRDAEYPHCRCNQGGSEGPASRIISTCAHGLFTGLSGLMISATMSLIWSIVRTALAPKRGISEQGAVACGL